MAVVATYRGSVDADHLGVTLIHEHVFVRDHELELNGVGSEWDERDAVARAVSAFAALHDLGVRTVVDLTVPGLGRDVRLVAAVANQTPLNLIASTGWYTPTNLPLYFAFHGPGRLIHDSDPLVDLFVRDIRDGIAGTAVRAGMLKVVTDAAGITDDVARVMGAAAIAHQETGVTITTHSHPATRNGLVQQKFLADRGVSLERVIIGHSGDSDDLGYLCELIGNGSTIGFDRFGMEHVAPDRQRITTLLALLDRGFADRIVLSHDAAIYSHVTPPSWRARTVPTWNMETISRRICPALKEAGVSDAQLAQMLVENPKTLLQPAPQRSQEDER